MIYKTFFKIILIIFLLITGTSGYANNLSISESKSKISKIKKEIETKKHKLNQLIRQEKNTLKDLSIVEKQIRDSERRLNCLREELTNVYKDVYRIQRSIYLTGVELKKKQHLLLKRLNAIYKYRGGDLLEILFITNNFADFSKQLYFMTLIAKADNELINDIKRKKNIYLQKENILQSKCNKISNIKKSQQIVLNNQKKLEEDKNRLLSNVRSEKSFYQQQIAKLERDSLELAQLIKRLEVEKKEVRKYALQGEGDLPWPVKSRNLYRGFGKYKHPKFNVYAVNQGIDILAREGETVISIKEGKVVFADWFKGYGKLVMIDHGKGLYSLYAYLANILVSVNQNVSQGTPIGRVGNPFVEEGYNLHFEIRVNGQPVNPLNWLMR